MLVWTEKIFQHTEMKFLLELLWKSFKLTIYSSNFFSFIFTQICHNKSGDINPSKIQSLVEAYVKKIRHSKKKKPSNTLPLPGSTGAPMFPSMSTAKTAKK